MVGEKAPDLIRDRPSLPPLPQIRRSGGAAINARAIDATSVKPDTVDIRQIPVSFTQNTAVRPRQRAR
jgi:hypothetical protein